LIAITNSFIAVLSNRQLNDKGNMKKNGGDLLSHKILRTLVDGNIAKVNERLSMVVSLDQTTLQKDSFICTYTVFLG